MSILHAFTLHPVILYTLQVRNQSLEWLINLLQSSHHQLVQCSTLSRLKFAEYCLSDFRERNSEWERVSSGHPAGLWLPSLSASSTG